MKINFKNLKKNSSIPLLIVDWIMLNLIILNLLWMIFDFSFNTQIFQDVINQLLNNKKLVEDYGNNAYKLLINEYSVKKSYDLIIEKLIQ